MSFNIKAGIQRTLEVIKNTFHQHKFLFVLLLLLQITFFLALFYVLITFQIKIAENIQNVVAPFQTANYDVESLQAGQPFLNEMYQVYKAYQSLKDNLLQMALWLLGIFIFMNGPIWLISHYLSHKEDKKISFLERSKTLAQQFLKFLVSFLAFFGPFILVSYLVIKTFFSFNLMSDSLSSIGNLPFYILLIFIFSYCLFLLVCAIINISSWKLFLKKFFTLMTKKILKVISIALINLILLGIPIYLIYLTIGNQALSLWTSLFTFLLILMFIFTRIFWISSLQEFAGDKN